MAFRQSKPTWPGAPDRFRKELEAIGIPDAALHSETRFINYLTEGAVQGLDIQLSDLTNDQFWKLFGIVNRWYDMETLNFTACEKRRLSTPSEE
ncbi:MAG: hypothetical protein AB8C95_07420 [Phycisphaeraceae bacterium]